MQLSEDQWKIVAYVLCVFFLLAFAGYAVIYCLWHKKRQAKQSDTESFLTARGTQHTMRLAWSFFAGAAGAWTIVTPASYSAYAGIVGLAAYAVSTGLPVVMIGFLGPFITRKLPHCYSLSDYIGWRFGPVARTFVMLVAMFNMSIVIIAEYTTIGSLFKSFVNTVAWPVIMVVGVVTLTYTAYGGLLVSIVTDQAQGFLSMVFLTVVSIYVGVTFDHKLPSLPDGTNCSPDRADSCPMLAPSEAGYWALFVMPASLISATVFSEAMWQRVWASTDDRSLKIGAIGGGVLVTILVFVLGFFGFLANWAGLISPNTDPNLYLFQVFAKNPQQDQVQVSAVIHVLVLIIAVTLNESAVDSIQNGLAAAIGGQFFKDRPLMYARIAVVLINVPLFVIGLRGLNVLSLFLVTNILCSSCFIPVVIGIFDFGHDIITEGAMLLGCLGGILGSTAVGIYLNWVPGSVAESFRMGADWTWYSNGYDKRAFAATLGCSILGMLLWIVPVKLWSLVDGGKSTSVKNSKWLVNVPVVGTLLGGKIAEGAAPGGSLPGAVCGSYTDIKA